MKKYIFITVILFFFFCPVSGQITTEEEPVSFGISMPPLQKSGDRQKVMPPIDIDAIEQEDADNEASGNPPRFGFSLEANYNLTNSGEWITLSNGDRLWRLSISCPGALSIMLLYDAFWLPEGAKFFIYTPDQSHSIGAITSANNKGERDNIRGFATELMYGDEVILEYYVPADVVDIGVISIAYVVHGYRYIFVGEYEGSGYGASLSCHINVNCPDYYKWKKEKNAVALILMGSSLGASACTGALINTTENNYHPYFLTADHCLNDVSELTYPNLDYWTFYWHYESPECTSSDPGHRKLRYSTSGATIKAANSVTDFALLELKEDPRNKNKVTPFYLGWDRSEYPGNGGVGIHHPVKDIKKISTANAIRNYPNTLTWTDGNENIVGTSLPNTHWKIDFINGTTENGSSGSPFINNELRVIGQLHGGPSGCAPISAYYGKFNVSWDYDASIDKQLKYWLDPLNLGVMRINGTFVCNGNATIEDKTFTKNTSEEACRITITNTTFKNNITGNFYAQEKIVLNTGTKAESGTLIRFMVKGNAGLATSSGNGQKSISNAPQEETLVKSENKKINIFPNPNSGTFTIQTNNFNNIKQIQVINPLGQIIYTVQNPRDNNITLPSGVKGTYFVRITTETESVTKKILVE